MTPTIKEQILAVRDTGLTNMFDVPVVRELAEKFGYAELAAYLPANTEEYARFILYGEEDHEQA